MLCFNQFNSYVLSKQQSLIFNGYTFKMSNHGYHTRNNTPPTENQTPQQSNVSTDQSSNDETSQTARLESKLLSRFDYLSTEFLNLKDVIKI